MEHKGEQEHKQEKMMRYMRFQCIFSVAAAICCFAALVAVCTMIPKVTGLAEQMGGVLDNLDTVAQQLAEADLAGMAENIDALTVTSRQGVEQAVDKLNTVDLDTLNKAIKNLGDVVEPLARFFNIFN